MFIMVASVETSIWERLVDPSWSHLGPEAAQAILQIRFQQHDVDRMNQLAARAQTGALTEVEQNELDTYIRIGRMVSVLQSKARMSLKRPGNP
jgi:hypothetical protein